MTIARDPLDPRWLGAESLRRYLHGAGLWARKDFSQNFLVDREVLEAIVDAAAPGPGRRVLEIGPGLGVLTGALLAAGADVTAVEIDRRLAKLLRSRYAEQLARGAGAPTATMPTTGGSEPPADEPPATGSLRLIEADVLDVPVSDLVEAPYDLVANLPYHITSPVLHHTLGEEPRPDRFVLMVQREVAERIAAKPGAMSYLSAFVQYHADVSLVRVVPPESFEPVPGVDSAVLAGTVRPRRLDEEAEGELWRLVQAGFRERRKMLHNVLPRQLPAVGRGRFVAALAEVGIAPDRRPQTVSVEEWLALSAALGPLEA